MKVARFAIWTLLALFAVSGAASAQRFAETFFAPLSGAQEVPSVETTGRGTAVLSLSRDESELSFMLIVAGLTGVTQAHIHCGPRGANGPVAVFLFGFVADGVDVDGILAGDGLTDAEIIEVLDSAVCPGGVSDLADLVGQMRDGNAYVNVHTLANPPGEVRGQIGEAGPRKRRPRR